MQANPGGQVRGKDFFGREKEVKRIWRVLNKRSLMITAPRRLGKTSIIYNLLDEPQQGWIPIFTDLEECYSSEEFVWNLLQKGKEAGLLNKISHWFKQTISKIESIGWAEFKVDLKQSPEAWKDLGRDILKQFANNLNGKRLLFLLDEFPLMLANIINKSGKEPAKEILNWVRNIRQDHLLGQQIRFVYSGSIGMDIILTKLEYHGAMNDVDNMIITHYSTALARELSQKLLVGEDLYANKESIPTSIMDHFLSLSGTIPFFIQMLVADISRLVFDEELPITDELLSRAYQEGVLGRENEHYFKHYYYRLKQYYTAEEREAALGILAQIARIGMVEEDALFQTYLMKTQNNDRDKFKNLMGMLEGDFYVVCDHQRKDYCFWSPVLRDWWRKYKL